MNRKKIFGLAIVLIFVVSKGLFAQSANNEQRIIGTWTVIVTNLEYLDSIWTFNSNGTLIINNSGERTSQKYIIAGSKIIIENIATMDIDFSTDGRSVIISASLGYGIALRKN
jgi:hypothetical protein